MSSSKPIPQRINSPSNSHAHDIASSLAASFRAGSPIAQEALARDLAADSDWDEGETPFDDDASDVSVDPHGPIMYRRPSGVAYGTTRPAVGPRPMDDPVLTQAEMVQSRNEEMSLLRDNHILPPKHPIPEKESFGRRLYKKLFSTKVPLKEYADEEAPSAPLSRVVSEASALLGENGHGYAQREIQAAVDEQWDAAVAAGHIKTTWQREAKTIAVYSRSLVVTFLLQYSINVASIFAVGHIGKIELGAISRKFFPFIPWDSICSRLTNRKSKWLP